MTELNIIKIILDDLQNNTLSIPPQNIINILKEADDLYYNDEESFLTDSEYDFLRHKAEQIDPTNIYFLGVGSEVRGGKVKLPVPLGSLDQIQIGEISDWIEKWNLQTQNLVITDKLDGVSALVVYDNNGDFQIAFSRGDGIFGADTSRHIKYLIPNNIGHKALIRGEVIIPIDNFSDVCYKVKSKSGNEYKNPRNAVAGLMNSEKINPSVYQLIHFIAYEIIDFNGSSKVNMIQNLQNMGFKTPATQLIHGSELNDLFLENLLQDRRTLTEYEIDGLVIDVNLVDKRQQMNPTRDTLNPAYSVKYKIADTSNYAETKVVNIEWRPSKHGYLKPRIEVESVELVGVTVTYCTGYNAKYIKDNNIGIGSIVAISRMGDVVPNIIKTISSTTAQLPDVPYYWTKNDNNEEVDIILEDYHLNETVQINQLIDFFASIDAPHLRKGNILKLWNAGFNSIESIIQLPESTLIQLIGENGKKIYIGLRKILTNIPCWKLMGSTNFFGRGIGTRKIKKLVEAMGCDRLYKSTKTEIARVDGFDDKTAERIAAGMPQYLFWVEPLLKGGYVMFDTNTTISEGNLNDQKIVFTGFRDKQLQAQAEALGATMQSAVSGKTTLVVTSDPTSTSGKIQKAQSLGIKIVSIEDFKNMF